MAGYGPAPEPLALRLAKGSTRATRKAIAAAPTPPVGDAAPPPELDDAARATWLRIVPILRTMRVLTAADLNAVGRYCSLHAAWLRLAERLKGDSDSESWGAALKSSMELSTRLLRIEQEFGLTPSARTRIDVKSAERGPAVTSGVDELFKPIR
jgi:P27 family predicted phage terminase small subunit